MKGISLVTETVVVFIIAGVALVILLAFFKGTGGRGADMLTLERSRSDLCSEYMTLDMNCDGKPDVKAGEASPLNDIWQKKGLRNACKGLAVAGCESPGDVQSSLRCLQSCCIACPKTAGQE